MTDRIGVAAICLRISAAIYLIAGLAFIGYSLPSAQPTRLPSGIGWATGALCLAFAAGIELVARGLRRHRHWGWVAGVCILTLSIPTVLLPLGAVGLEIVPPVVEMWGGFFRTFSHHSADAGRRPPGSSIRRSCPGTSRRRRPGPAHRSRCRDRVAWHRDHGLALTTECVFSPRRRTSSPGIATESAVAR